MLISVCIPMYNESSIVTDTLDQLHTYLQELKADTGLSYEVLLSNDGSTDGCEQIAREHLQARGYENFRILGYPDNRGKGSAVREAMLASRGDIAVCTDCDLAFGTEVIGRVLNEFTDETDLVIGSRTLDAEGYKDYSLIRKLASRAYMIVLRLATGFQGSDSQCGFKAYRGEAARRIFSLCECNGFAFDQEVLMIASKFGYRIREFPVRILRHRESKVRLVRDTVKMLKDIRRIKKHVRDLG